MIRTVILALVVFYLPAYRPSLNAEEAKPLIQIALLLDTSNSMDGLIDQAKSQLWKVVNEFATAKRDGKPAELFVSLYEYGNDGLPANEGHIRQVLSLTADLDKVSEQLFALKTNGGQEYCGKVIQAAVDRLTWSKSGNDFKAIFIAGNEPFTQGDVDFRQSCKAAIEKGIIVNTIFCGALEEGIRTNWKDGAVLADGSYMSIDQNKAVVHIAAPQDAEIAKLGVELNKTYIAFGARGKASQERQAAQDSNAAAAAPGSATQRAVAKSSMQYRNDSWDLVDARKEGKIKLEELKDEDLPEEMRKMTAEQRKAHVETQAKERERIQQAIQKLNDERQQFVAVEMKERGQSDGGTLDAAMIKTCTEQLEKRSFTKK